MNSTPNLPMGLFFSLLVIVIFEKQLLHAAPSESRANHRENGIEQGTSHVRRSFRTIRSTDEIEPLQNDVTLRVRDLPWYYSEMNLFISTNLASKDMVTLEKYNNLTPSNF